MQTLSPRLLLSSSVCCVTVMLPQQQKPALHSGDNQKGQEGNKAIGRLDSTVIKTRTSNSPVLSTVHVSCHMHLKMHLG